jgi:hypothetical protein
VVQLAAPLRNEDAALHKHGAELIDQRGALCDEPIASTVKHLHVELLGRFQFDKPHRRTRRRFGDRFRIPVVVLVRPHVGAHKFRRHQPDLEAVIAQQATKVVGAPASLHRHDARLELRYDFEDIVSTQAPPHHDLPAAVVKARKAAYILAQVDPNNRDLRCLELTRFGGHLST